jgi:hypothetical protein
MIETEGILEMLVFNSTFTADFLRTFWHISIITAAAATATTTTTTTSHCRHHAN